MFKIVQRKCVLYCHVTIIINFYSECMTLDYVNFNIKQNSDDKIYYLTFDRFPSRSIQITGTTFLKKIDMKCQNCFSVELL